MPVTHPKFRAAAVQAAPVFLDLDASIDKAIAPDRARPPRNGAKLVAFPGDLAARLPVVHLARFAGLGHAVHPALPRQLAGLRQRRRPNASPRPRKTHGIMVVMGHSEKQGGSLYMGQWIIGADGETIAQRRKLKPTHVERTVFGEGDGSDLAVLRHAARPRRRAVLLGAPAAAVEVRDVRAERAGAHRRLAELLALSRRRLCARARGQQRGEPDLCGRGPVLRARALRDGVEGDDRRCCAATT